MQLLQQARRMVEQDSSEASIWVQSAHWQSAVYSPKQKVFSNVDWTICDNKNHKQTKCESETKKESTNLQRVLTEKVHGPREFYIQK